jgi:hypothetical protein
MRRTVREEKQIPAILASVLPSAEDGAASASRHIRGTIWKSKKLVGRMYAISRNDHS